MMKTAVLMLMLCASSALASPARYLYEEQLLTRDKPSAYTEGMAMTTGNGTPVRGLWVSVCAVEGETLSGGGYLRAWVWHPDAALWMRDPDLDKAVTVSGERCQSLPDLRPGYLGSARRVLWAADSVTVSDGDTVTVRIDGDTNL
jgi:hypothetical protein